MSATLGVPDLVMCVVERLPNEAVFFGLYFVSIMDEFDTSRDITKMGEAERKEYLKKLCEFILNLFQEECSTSSKHIQDQTNTQNEKTQ